MAQLPEKVLSWLYSVLHEYQDPRRAYSDAVRVLSTHSSLSPRTEVYTHESGSSALLLTISGTVPATFRGAAYKFPIKIWLPKAYPQEVPVLFVTPGGDMLVRPGQHVGVDGRIYHPYLRDWQGMWDRASLAEFLEFLQQVFAKEPPVISRAQQQQYYQRPVGGQIAQSQTAPGASPGPPRLPPKQQMGSAAQSATPQTNTSEPPPRPPKPGEEYAEPLPHRSSSRHASQSGPPLPPLPHERPASQQYAPRSQYHNGYASTPQPRSHVHPSLPQSYGHQNGQPPGSQPPVPPHPQHQQHEQIRSVHNRSPVSPVSPVSGYAKPLDQRYSQAPSIPQQPQRSHPYPRQPPPPQGQPSNQPANQYQGQHPRQHTAQYLTSGQYYQQPPTSQLQKPQPPPDLLSDPFDVTLPGPSTAGPAPPIPPNPEREHLLHALSTSIVQQARMKVHQNLSAIAPLQSQAIALQTAHQRLEAEIRQLEQLSQTLETNEAILRCSIADCDHLVANTKSKPQPPIDDVLVANSLVAQQLWRVCAEEAGCREAMYVLQKALDRGRISGQDFVKAMRGLGREVFGKMVVGRKCGRGLGLEVGPGMGKVR
ncbi:Suppressor protein stp22 of temperature-sensitive alpha-factor receptor and arginine permease [Recurvomyces mirabilis]|uniref:Suppressor protein stp22 of temperature-sensitive alpha-factor receptor and arginine permease n=1 Tax=Recurvomyces mirabilis TaxID=574656 RepID=A0AAE0TRF2_9PEZI|nr:Suppressor protein stp22 of temperature-sensitive alpha-factor receptor and arginine permease [Recurvomyces mirabilis]KAK5151637.1 suppressor protein stp22 of temperature-sensitive alpha-factor receptor and arginine permease [Recurvomyces mirabilis]